MDGFSSDVEAVLEQLDAEVDDTLEDIGERVGPVIRRLRPKGGGYVRHRPTPGATQYVTQAQLQAALTRVGADIKKNTVAITAVGKRVDEHSKKVDKELAAIKKINTEQSRQIQRSRETAILTMLLSRPPAKTVTTSFDPAIPVGTKVLVEEQGGMGMLLPILLLSDGFGGGSSSGSSSGGSDNTMLLALAFSGAL